MNTISKIFSWVVLSSANPERVSLTVRAALIALIPFAMKLTLVGCTLGVCVTTSEGELAAIANVLSNIAFWSLSLYAGIAFLVGVVRKFYTTIAGTNQVINS